MANFIVIIDSDSERRSRFIKTIEPLLPLVEGLSINSCATGDFHAIWAAHPHAPISFVADSEGAAVIWGEAIVQTSSERMTALGIRDLGKTTQTQNFPLFDGFYAAVVYHPYRGITVAADLLGIFPVYYYTHNNVILIGSSPELFRHHPLFKVAFNPAGLVGILLTNGLIDGQTLWQDVRRLDAGHLLVWQSGTVPQEVRQYPIPAPDLSGKYAKLSVSEQLDILEQTLDQALTRHVPVGEPYSLLLSGGLDSRLLAGFLHRQGIKPIAFTLGKRLDLEMECAIPVARSLGLKHRSAEVSFENYLFYADLVAKWEHLASGCNNIMGWGTYPHLRNLAPRVITGYLMDQVIGGSGYHSPSADNFSFEVLFADVNAWGFPPKVLEKLLQKEVFGNLVEDAIARIFKVYTSYSDTEFRRAWWFKIFHRNRFHVGSSAWRICFGAWPIIPMLDWQVLTIAAALPMETLAQRRAEKELLCRRFPQLARLPLDRIDFNVEPLQPSRRRQMLAPVFDLQRQWRRLQRKLGYERRYWLRIYDLNNAGWLAVRREAEQCREQMQSVFHQDEFNALLPMPDIPIPLKRGRDSLKSLIGFLLWSRKHL